MIIKTIDINVKEWRDKINGNSYFAGEVVLNWSPINDLYINYNRVEQIKKFMLNFLKTHNQEGFFYTGLNAIKI